MSLHARIIEELNYAQDRRNTHREAPETFTLADGTEIKLPYKWEVCSVCNGEGKHVNPSVDAGGISAEQFHDDPEFAEDYFSGAYDVQCQCCHGRTTERVIDLDRMKPEHRAEYAAQQHEDSLARIEQLSEIRMGC